MPYIDVNNEKIYYTLEERGDTHIFYIPGYKNTLETPTGMLIKDYCGQNNLTLTQLDFSGWGRSSGDSGLEGCIREWFAEALALFDKVIKPHQKVILCGLSMGGWIALALAQIRPEKVDGIMGISVGFGTGLYQDILKQYNATTLPLNAEKSMSLTCDDKDVVLDNTWKYNCPITLRYATDDIWVPKYTAESTINAIQCADLTVEFEDNDLHTLKTPEQMATTNTLLTTLIQKVNG